MGAPKGNKYWEFRDKHGRDHKYTPDELWEEALKYFKWVEDNPLYESVIISRGITINKGTDKEKTTYSTDVPKMRAMTELAFCLYADISHQTWANYKSTKDFIDITTRIRDVIYSYKFDGAAATLLNPNIIARDLGLSDSKDITSKGKELKQLTDVDRNKILDDLENDR